MTWTPITQEQYIFGQQVIEWIRVARTQYGPDWLPSPVDLSKSALFERLRSGKEALPEPPPLGYSCPWYALVEDPGPHFLHEVTTRDKVLEDILDKRPLLMALQNPYQIEKTIVHDWDTDHPRESYIVKDARHDTSYRFKVWYDPEWVRHWSPKEKGGWFIQNMVFVKEDQS